MVVVLALLSAAAVIHAISRATQFSFRPAWALAAGVAALGLLTAMGPTAAWRHASIGAGREPLDLVKTRNDVHEWMSVHRRKVVWEADGIESSVAALHGASLAFSVNGKVDGSAQGDSGTQVMLGLLGALLHPNPKDSLVVGLGTGSTAGWLADVPTMDRVDVVELEPAVLRFARMCSAVNRNAMQHPKVNVIIGDAREIVQVTPRRYDIIASEPSNPYRVGIVSLFTREFYESAVSRLRPGGIFVQWVQGYEVDASAIRTVSATLGTVFPEIEMFRSTTGDLLFVASMEPLVFDVVRLRERLAQEPFKSALACTWRAWDLEGFLGRYVGNTALVRELGAPGEAEINTDDRTTLEFAFARGVGKTNGFRINDLHALARRVRGARPAISNGDVDWSAIQERWISIVLGAGQLDLRGMEFSEEQNLRTRAKEQYLLNNHEAALKAWQAQAHEPGDFMELSMLADLYSMAGDDRALPLIEKLRLQFPAEAGILLAQLRARQDDGDAAVEELARAYVLCRQDPWTWRTIVTRSFELVQALATSDESGEAARRLDHALAEPFAGRLAEVPRGRNRLALAERIDGRAMPVATAAAFEKMEPEPIWTRQCLELRNRVYQATNHRLASRAQADLEEYLRNEPTALPTAIESRDLAQRRD